MMKVGGGRKLSNLTQATQRFSNSQHLATYLNNSTTAKKFLQILLEINLLASGTPKSALELIKTDVVGWVPS